MSTVITPEIVDPSQVLPKVTDEQKLSLKVTDPYKLTCLQLLRESGGNVSRAAEALQISRQAIYKWRDTDPAFAEAWEDAIEFGTEHLEEAVYKRAVTISDTLAMFMLKARRPLVYRENLHLQSELSIDSDQLVATFAAAFDRLRQQRAAEATPQLEAAPNPDAQP